MSTVQSAAAPSATERPTTIGMQIHTGMLEALGINMYTSIAKSLVEFIANGFDAEASAVKIVIPFTEIAQAGSTLKPEDETLPEKIAIIIEDNGHGMTVQEIRDKFLIINRNRRKSNKSEKSENGKRFVMGRKGLGKLAGFGVAEQVIIKSKRKGETYSTTVVMDFNDIKAQQTVSGVQFSPEYQDGLPPEAEGTTIILRKLRKDALRYKEDAIVDTLEKNFFMTGEDFKISINEIPVGQPDIDYEFEYPPLEERDASGFGVEQVKVYEGFEYPIRYLVKFRARTNEELKDGRIRGPMPAAIRGARVYCNKRLAAGPTLFDLPTGMHNFHSQSYMECVVEADVLDREESDLIATNRSGLKTDNEVVDAFIKAVTEIMRVGVYEHGKFRDSIAEQIIEKDPISRAVLAAISALPTKTREPAKAVLKTLAATEGVESQVYKEVAPVFVKAVNSSEVLKDLIKSGINPESLKTIIGQLTELAGIERNDVLKLYRGRRHAIDGLQKLQDRSHTDVEKYEDELHELLKNNPWLIKPEYSKYLTSNHSMGTVAKELSAILQIDHDAKDVDKSKSLRPDLVFVVTDPSGPMHVSIIELKSPNVPLDAEHLTQLRGYIMDVEGFLKNNYGNAFKVTGHLIGNVPAADTSARNSKILLDEIQKSGLHSQWEVISIPALLLRTNKIHQDVVEALAKEEEEEEEEEQAGKKAIAAPVAQLPKALTKPPKAASNDEQDAGKEAETKTKP